LWTVEKPKALADSAREKRKNRRNLVPDVIAEKKKK